MKRFLAVAGAIALGLTVAACNGASPTATLATDAQLLANGLVALEPFIPTANAAVLKQVEAAAATIAKDAAALAANPNQSVAQEIGTVAGDVVPLVVGLFPGGGTAVTIVQAIVALLPEFEQLAGVNVAHTAPVMSPAMARAVLSHA